MTGARSTIAGVMNEQIRVIDDVAEPSCRGRGFRDARVQRAVVGRRDDEPDRLDGVGLEALGVVRDLALGREVDEGFRPELGGDDVDLGSGAEQQRRTALGDRAAADDQAGAVVSSAKRGR